MDNPARARGDPADHGLLARSWASPASASTRCRSSSRSRRTGAAAAAIHFEYLQRLPRASCSGARRRRAARRGERRCRDETQQYFGDGDGLHMMFNFLVNQHLFSRSPRATRGRSRRRCARRASSRPTAQWAHFLRNHDELDLGRLHDEQRAARVRARSARSRRCSSTTAASAGGWRRCSATAAGSSWRTASCSPCRARRCSATATRSGWATTSRCRSATAIRTPMQWSTRAERRLLHAPTSSSRPVVVEGPYGYENVNVERQRRDPDSLLRWIDADDPAAQGVPGDRLGRLEASSTTGSPHVLALLYHWRGNAAALRSTTSTSSRTRSRYGWGRKPTASSI